MNNSSDSRLVCDFKRITTAAEGKRFAYMTMRRYRSFLTDHVSDARVIAYGAVCGAEVVGLVICLIESKHTAEVLTVYVRPEFRRRGVATQLVAMVEEIVSELQIENMFAGVRPDSNSRPLEGVLNHLGWNPTPKRVRILHAMCSSEMKLADAPWYRKKLNDPRVSIFNWATVSKEDLEHLLHISRQPDCWFPQTLSPLIDNTNLHGPTSIGLRFENEIIGWSLTHRFGGGPILFSVMFARAVPFYPLAGLHLLHATASRLLALGKTENAVLTCTIADGNKFYEFMERKVFAFLPTSTKVTDVFRKELREFEPVVPALPYPARS